MKVVTATGCYCIVCDGVVAVACSSLAICVLFFCQAARIGLLAQCLLHYKECFLLQPVSSHCPSVEDSWCDDFPLCAIAFEAVAFFFMLIGDHCEKGFKLVLPVPAACMCVIIEGDGSPPPQSSATEPGLLA